MADDTDRNEGMDDLRAAIRQLQAEMEWVKVVLLKQEPKDGGAKTSPPWLATITALMVAILPTIILVYKPFG